MLQEDRQRREERLSGLWERRQAAPSAVVVLETCHIHIGGGDSKPCTLTLTQAQPQRASI